MVKWKKRQGDDNMKHLKIYVSMLLAACMLLPSSARAAVFELAEAKQEQEYAEGEAMILYREQSASAHSSIEANGLAPGMQIEETYEFGDVDVSLSARAKNSSLTDNSGKLKVSLVKSDQYSTEELVKRLGARKDVLAAEPNYRIHALAAGTDDYAKYQWAFDNQGQNHGTPGLDVNPDQEIFEAGDAQKECVIALVDTGIDYTHDDLKNVVWNNPVKSNQLRGAHGYDFINSDTDPMDDNGHGSHCSGVMAAEHGNGGIRGVAKNPNVKIMGLKILDEDGSGYGMEAVGAYNYIYKAQQLGINVVAVNNSWGGASEEESVILKTLIDLVGEKGAVSVCAAGNDGVDSDKAMELPSCIDSKYILSVAATNEDGELAAFSNYGRETVDLAAPGADILSTVSYDCFNPGIYDNPDEYCSVYEDFTDGNPVMSGDPQEGAIAYGYVTGGGSAELSVSLSDEAYFGLRGDAEKSLKWNISGAKEGDIYTVYFPYMAGVSREDTHGSMMVKAVGPDVLDSDGESSSAVCVSDVQILEDGSADISQDELGIILQCIGGVYIDKGNYWNHISGFASGKHGEEKERAVAVSLIVSADGDYQIYLDNMGVSKENMPSGQFGKYDYYNGTSMAAPHVTGAMAAIACAYPEEDALDRVARILGCVGKSDALKEKVLTGGALDLSKAGEPNVYVRNISLDKDKNIRIEGKGLSGAAVTVDGKEVAPKTQSEKELILDSAGLLDRTLQIVVTAGERVFREKRFFTKGAGFNGVGAALGNLNEGFAVSDGEQIYFIDHEGAVSVCRPDQKDETGNLIWMEEGMGYSSGLFGFNDEWYMEYSIRNISDIICLDNKLWTVLKMDLQYSEEKILACYDSEKGWTAASKLPKEFESLEGISIAAHQGKLYLLGGFDCVTGDLQTHVKKMDPLTLKWEAEAPLPQARAFSQAKSIGSQLIVTLGRNEEGSFPCNLIFNGKTWSLSKSAPGDAAENHVYTYYDSQLNERAIGYYGAWVGAVNNGLIYAGLGVEKMGDVFFYQQSSDRYVSANYSVLNTAVKDRSKMHAVAMQDKCYLLAQEKEDTVRVFAMPVQSPCISVIAPGMENGYVEGGSLTGVRHYMPGDVVSIEAEAEEGYFIKSFTADGINVAKNSKGKYEYRAAANEAGKKITASVKFGAYVMALAIEEELALYAGQTYQLEAYIIPENAENQKIVWSSSNPGIVSVNQNGEVSVSASAKTGNSAVITAKAADRGTVKAVCAVTVSDMPLPEKNDIAPSGKLMYLVTKSSAKKKTVSCVGFADKAVSNVKIPDTVKINGYKFQVTAIAKDAFAKNKKIKSVTIGKNVTSIGGNAFLNCSSLKSVQIKGTRIKTIGKNAFQGLNKKATVSVPRKQKKAYAKKLKKAGFSGKVK